MREPGPDHPITIAPHANRVRVSVGSVAVADTRAALRLSEASYLPVLYIPRTDATFVLFRRSARTSHCPYKGAASYYDIVVNGAVRPNAVWSYEDPFPAVEAIRGHLAFYPDKVDAIEEG
ncbi:DUF427 domain-containing protein [Methylobacterium oxalidis]|uniref:DUF427 domain-containing protein n=1 Tax=Methylobacterium oxalidis TaxID=944322 RepID=A0A512IYE1_9HYPH|nr:DUF427 domain-containing protein [Methylobacterium oxalidis]GEP02724.1 hypothetical protein MOX02_07620 [Methylobacterium oxalidis]GJE33570.1 hypothetical protein LDDCCGHA_3771 [Methylobacterium oxalidis]GLS66878.1 hypothetical protein GCM10007888_52610 [Methylobacterium oxalidis]